MLKCNNCELVERKTDEGTGSDILKCSVSGEFVSPDDKCKLSEDKALTIMEQMLSVVRGSVE